MQSVTFLLTQMHHFAFPQDPPLFKGLCYCVQQLGSHAKTGHQTNKVKPLHAVRRRALIGRAIAANENGCIFNFGLNVFSYFSALMS